MKMFYNTIYRALPVELRAMAKRIIGTNARVDRAIVREYRQKYGRRFIASLDKRDEMYRFYKRICKNEYRSQEGYFQSGESAFLSLCDVLRDHEINISPQCSFMEFASGYGRITRFLVLHINVDNYFVSDIDEHAVRFNSETFGTRPVIPAECPDDFIFTGPVDIVFVASLFSHLSIDKWRSWLVRLYDLVSPGGVLVFSTHGQGHKLPTGADEYLVEDGFWFTRENETEGRLNRGVYGTTWVTREWVEHTVNKLLGVRPAFYPQKLWKQDVYVARKGEQPNSLSKKCMRVAPD